MQIAKKEAETATAHLSAQTKREVELTERKKVADAKIKKCTKAIAEVCTLPFDNIILTIWQDKASKSEADHNIRHNTDILERSQAEVDKLEESLGQEEKKLEEIVDSLKGEYLN